MQMADLGLPDDDDDEEEKSSTTAVAIPEWRQSIDWAVVVWGLWREVSEDVVKSHGDESTFAKEVYAFGSGSELFGMELRQGEKEREWGRLRVVAEEVLK